MATLIKVSKIENLDYCYLKTLTIVIRLKKKKKSNVQYMHMQC